MPILSIQVNAAGQAGVTPRIIYVNTSDPLATVKGAGYLNEVVSGGIALFPTDFAVVTTSDSGVGSLAVSVSDGNWSLVSLVF
jgi:hypothetical protein